mgnify:CR=1 FL=1
MDEKSKGKSNITKIVLVVFVVLVVFIIFIGVIFKILYGQQTKPGDLGNNQTTTESDLTKNSQTKTSEPVETVSQEKIQNQADFVNTGRLIQIDKNNLAVKDEVSGKMSEAKLIDKTIIYRWSLSDGNLEKAKVSDLVVGQKVALSYIDENKGNNEVSVMSLYPPFMVTGIVESVDGEKMIINDTNEGKKYTANFFDTKITKMDDAGQKVSTSISDIVQGDRVIAYSDYGVEYQKSNFDVVVVDIIVKNNAKLVTPDTTSQPITSVDDSVQPVNVATPPPVGINPGGTLPGVEIGS